MHLALDYEKWIHLDAENLAETGIGRAYEALLPLLRTYTQLPALVQEEIDEDLPRYVVKCGNRVFSIIDPSLDDTEGKAWGRATCAFFSIVNDQLLFSDYRFYAMNGGHNLGGMFLTPSQVQAALASLPNRTDWPYLPNDDPPWFGMYH